MCALLIRVNYFVKMIEKNGKKTKYALKMHFRLNFMRHNYFCSFYVHITYAYFVYDWPNTIYFAPQVNHICTSSAIVKKLDPNFFFKLFYYNIISDFNEALYIYIIYLLKFNRLGWTSPLFRSLKYTCSA